MPKSNSIQLNFLPIEAGIDRFVIYRKRRSPGDAKPDDGVFEFRLPSSPGDADWLRYLIRFTPATGFEPYTAETFDNIHLTRRVLSHGLLEAMTSQLDADTYELPRKSYYEDVALNFTSHPEGVEQLRIQPYLLKSKHQFGWLLDFHFRMNDEVTFSRRVQQLSLSLDKNFKRNLDSYHDRFKRIQIFLSKRRAVLDAVSMPEASNPISTAKEFITIQSRRLRSKNYLFDGMRDSRSQFSGLRQYGPLQGVSTEPKLLFAFRERDRPAARTLAMALRGTKSRERFSFPGFQALFKSDIAIDGNPIVLDDLTSDSFEKALARVQEERKANSATVPVFVLPEGDDNGYLNQKAIFSHAGIPTQACTLKVINDEYTLKWSIANIALQIFCKAGGQPWKVQPTKERTLIIGISQSHKLKKVDGRTEVEKYFAFSVMTDNSGLFQRLQVLGESGSKEEYLESLKVNLSKVLAYESKSFSQVVIHTSFKMKRDEMRAIGDTVQSASKVMTGGECRFAVVKVNHKNRFFGFNTDVNSLVPYEGSVTSLGGGEYLVWFEGIFPDKPTVNKAFPGPTHVSFLHRSTEDPIADDALLQDLINLSGANWRGFNAKSAPVSVFYCHLVADLVQRFQQNDLPLPSVQDLRPWFL